jgi:hypothetical protein
MPARKRQAPATPETSGRRRSQRIGSSGKKSRYFEADSDVEDEDDYEDADEEEEEEDDAGDEYDESEEKGPRVVKGRGRPKAKRSRENDDESEAEDDDEAEGGPRVTFIPRKEMRGTGGVDYEDDRLHQNTMLFLKDLRANNKRTWLKGMLRAARFVITTLVSLCSNQCSATHRER